MAFKDLVPWKRGRDIAVRRGEEGNPFLMLHREMNRLFDDFFRGFDLVPFGAEPGIRLDVRRLAEHRGQRDRQRGQAPRSGTAS